MSKPNLISTLFSAACVLTLIFAADAGYWALLVYAVDVCSYCCGLVRGRP